jgi:hypothetical protein
MKTTTLLPVLPSKSYQKVAQAFGMCWFLIALYSFQGIAMEVKIEKIDPNNPHKLFDDVAYDLVALKHALNNNTIDIERRNYKGETILMRVCGIGDVAAIKLLLEKGASVEAKNDEGKTAVFYAVSNVRIDALRLLISHGVNLEVKDQLHNTPLDYARKIDLKEMLSLFNGVMQLKSLQNEFKKYVHRKGLAASNEQRLLAKDGGDLIKVPKTVCETQTMPKQFGKGHKAEADNNLEDVKSENCYQVYTYLPRHSGRLPAGLYSDSKELDHSLDNNQSILARFGLKYVGKEKEKEKQIGNLQVLLKYIDKNASLDEKSGKAFRQLVTNQQLRGFIGRIWNLSFDDYARSKKDFLTTPADNGIEKQDIQELSFIGFIE